MKKIVLRHSLVLLPLVYLFWILIYPNTLRWMEAMSFFSTLPDFTQLQVRYLADYPDYVGAFLLQFYRWAWLGALLQTLFAWLVMFSADVVVYRLTKRSDRMWLSFVAVGALLAFQAQFTMLGNTLLIVVVSLVVALLTWLVTSKKDDRSKPNLSPLNLYILPSILIVAGCVVSYSTKENRVRERIYRVEFLAEQGEWDKILKIVTPEVAAQDPVRRRYALLALLENGQLSNKMFSYGVTSSDDFFFPHSVDHIGLSFNGYFNKSLSADNEAMHSWFQLNSISRFGYSARAMRGIVDTALKQRDVALAEKYIRILLSSTCHKNWVKPRIKQLSALRYEPKVENNPESDIWSVWHGEHPVVIETAGLFEADPTNKKLADVLCCGLLASRQLPKFMNVFNYALANAYKGIRHIPIHYEEALLLASRQDPSVLQRFPISSFKQSEFQRFAAFMDSGNTTQAAKVHGNTYWAYHFLGR